MPPLDGLIHVEMEIDPSGNCDSLFSFLLFMVKEIEVAKVQAFFFTVLDLCVKLYFN